MSRNLIIDEERKMRQDMVATEMKKEFFIREIVEGLGEEIMKEPNKVVPKLSFFGKVKKLFS
jgi:low affinity Fe/Cu permease